MISGSRRASGPQRQGGVGYLLLLFVLAVMGVTLAGTGEVWHTTSRRDKEAELLFIGQQFRLALASYRARSPEGTPTAPESVEELLEDRRYPMPVRHLRKAWCDPLTNEFDWEFIRVDGRIVALHSRVDEKPLRTAFEPRDAAFKRARSYRQWIFGAI